MAQQNVRNQGLDLVQSLPASFDLSSDNIVERFRHTEYYDFFKVIAGKTRFKIEDFLDEDSLQRAVSPYAPMIYDRDVRRVRIQQTRNFAEAMRDTLFVIELPEYVLDRAIVSQSYDAITLYDANDAGLNGQSASTWQKNAVALANLLAAELTNFSPDDTRIISDAKFYQLRPEDLYEIEMHIFQTETIPWRGPARYEDLEPDLYAWDEQSQINVVNVVRSYREYLSYLETSKVMPSPAKKFDDLSKGIVEIAYTTNGQVPNDRTGLEANLDIGVPPYVSRLWKLSIPNPVLKFRLWKHITEVDDPQISDYDKARLVNDIKSVSAAQAWLPFTLGTFEERNLIDFLKQRDVIQASYSLEESSDVAAMVNEKKKDLYEGIQDASMEISRLESESNAETARTFFVENLNRGANLDVKLATFFKRLQSEYENETRRRDNLLKNVDMVIEGLWGQAVSEDIYSSIKTTFEEIRGNLQRQQWASGYRLFIAGKPLDSVTTEDLILCDRTRTRFATMCAYTMLADRTLNDKYGTAFEAGLEMGNQQKGVWFSLLNDIVELEEP